MNEPASRPWLDHARAACVIALLVLAFVGMAYWPVHRNGFVWDDVIDFVDHDWLTAGDQWKHYLFRDFNGWENYFRPLGVGFFAVQLRLFAAQPAPMHLVSLALHLLDTVLVGLVARHCSRAMRQSSRAQALWTGMAMLLFGLHPVLIEVVAWIGCQFDQIATLLMLLGLLASSALHKPGARAGAVAGCFFAAACAKESVAVFPLLLLVFDWALQARERPDNGLREFSIAFARRNAPIVLAMLLAGAAYLAFRRWGLGHLLAPVQQAEAAKLSGFGQALRVTDTFLQYLRMLLLPAHGLNPIHDVDIRRYAHPALPLVGAMACFAGGILLAAYAALVRRSVPACIALCMVVALLPVLNLAPTAYSESPWHERYAINALAMACIMLPLLRWPALRVGDGKPLRLLAGALILFWLAATAAVIRGTVPLWRSNETLWMWALAGNPHSRFAQEGVTALLLRDGRDDDAANFSAAFIANGDDCWTCALSVAYAQMEHGRLDRAQALLDALHSRRIDDANAALECLLARGHLALLQGHPAESERLMREALRRAPGNPKAQAGLAEALASPEPAPAP